MIETGWSRGSRVRRPGGALSRVWLAVLLLVGMTTARQLVLCVAPDQHVSVEAQHPGSGCVDAEPSARMAAALGGASGAEHCSDIPLVVRSVTTAGADEAGVDAQSAAGLALWDDVSAPCVLARSSLSFSSRAPHPHLRALGTIVLQS